MEPRSPNWWRKAGATPLFVYSGAMLRARVAELRAAMPERLAIHYAMKANPFAPAAAFDGRIGRRV
jgi:diaminopimelate decarboxylase